MVTAAAGGSGSGGAPGEEDDEDEDDCWDAPVQAGDPPPPPPPVCGGGGVSGLSGVSILWPGGGGVSTQGDASTQNGALPRLPPRPVRSSPLCAPSPPRPACRAGEDAGTAEVCGALRRDGSACSLLVPPGGRCHYHGRHDAEAKSEASDEPGPSSAPAAHEVAAEHDAAAASAPAAAGRKRARAPAPMDPPPATAKQRLQKVLASSSRRAGGPKAQVARDAERQHRMSNNDHFSANSFN